MKAVPVPAPVDERAQRKDAAAAERRQVRERARVAAKLAGKAGR